MEYINPDFGAVSGVNAAVSLQTTGGLFIETTGGVILETTAA